ncbi:MFS transporter [Limnofasciculus baicalensis]|uniref:MFS transporter n=1 Tax=Limnofasciculus baicalensis BBK-W-15 TaxID=2699891 RepID=A0AAE3GNT0_9CYAN|nr:MFS transporter [Limnofasciculus baicalensis]MCP2727976.1 MFS transporter [Limnofasciculus baicalensis BBK-W-15]
MISQNKYNPDALIVKSTLLLSSTLIVFAAASLTPALPAMQEHFADLDNVGLWVKLVIAIPSLFILLGAPVIGIGVDYVGRKLILVISIILFGLFGTLGFFIHSIFGILVSRALLGLATAGITTSVITLIGDYYSGQARVKLLGLQAAFIGIGAVTALLIGGVLADYNWRNPFLIHLLAFLLLPLILFVIREPEGMVKKPQSSSTESAQTTLNQPSDEQPKSQSIEVSVPKKLLLFIYFTALLGEVMLYLVPVHLPFYLQAMTGANAKQNSIAIVAMSLFFIIGSLLFVKLKERLDYMTVVVVSLGLVSIGYEIVGLVNDYRLVLLGLTICGLGAGFLIPNLDSWLTAIVPATYRGRAVGGLTASTFLGQFLSPILTQPLIQNLDFDLDTAYGLVYIISGYVLTVFVIVTFIIEQVKKENLEVESLE